MRRRNVPHREALQDFSITGDGIRIVPFLREYLEALAQWDVHESNLYREYNYADYTREELEQWHAERTDRRNQYYAVFYEDALIGFVGLKQISWIRRSSVLGYAIDPKFAGKGLGTKVLDLFLHHYFKTLRFRSMELYVYAYNQRAIHMYEKLGFVIQGISYDVFHNPENFPSEDELKQYSEVLNQKKDHVLAQVLHMRIRR